MSVKNIWCSLFPKTLLPALAIFFANAVAAQNFNPFTTPVYFWEGDRYSTQVEMADLDGDGRDDVVSLAYSWYIDWYGTDAQGKLTERHVINAEPKGYGQMRLIDWDADQDVDVLYYVEQDQYYWQANDGSGQFGPAQPLVSPPKQLAVWGVEDVNQDGFPDLLSLYNELPNLDSIVIQWQANDGAGNLSAPQVIDHGGLSIQGPSVVDVDGDADPDLTWISLGFQIMQMLNDGAGNFGPPQTGLTDSLLYPVPLKGVDFDADGDLDLYPGINNYYAPVYYPNDGTGHFGPAVYFTGDSSGYYGLFTVADFSGDGLPDLFMEDVSRNIVQLTNNGPGKVFSKKVFPADGNDFYAWLAAGDVDGDGDPDIIRIKDDYRLLWMANDGAGNFFEFDNLYPEISASVVTSADLDGDGLKDYIVGDAHANLMAWFRNTGNGDFGPKKTIGYHLDGLTQIIPADLDGDADIDIFTKDYDGKVKWFANDGSGLFGPGQVVGASVTFGNSTAYVVDFDQDQDLDILTADSCFFNDGAGHFDSTMTFLFQEGFTPYDLDGDQDLDIFYGLQWLENKADGTFAWRTSNLQPLGGTYNQTTQLIDMDGDSIPEVFQTTQNPWWILFTRQNNVFSGPLTPIDTLGIYQQNGMPFPRLQSADMDSDRRPDLLIRDYQGFGNHLIGFNGGQGKFTGWAAFHFNGLIEPADFNNDGIPDLQCVQTDSNNIGWMRSFMRDYYLAGVCFLDENENGLRDAGEPPLQNIGVALANTGQVSFSNETGSFRLYADPTAAHQIQFLQNICWQYSSDSSLLSLAPSNTGYPNLEFGFQKTGDTTGVQVAMTSAPTRCDTEVPFWTTLQNIACRTASGRFGLLTDPLAEFQSATPAPDQISPGMAGRDTLWWAFDSIPPSHIRDFRALFLMPDANHVGDSIRLQCFLFLKNDQQQLILNDSSAFVSEIRCAFDPNDKLVNRTELPPDYESAESTLLYTIRFQNTGNDTARTVTIRDTLDAWLDLSTFQTLGASHPYRCELNWNTRGVSFVFDNIALPDSNVNEPQSHGFVSFSILPFAGLPSGGVFTNRADIYFDQNPPVSTNRVETAVQYPVGIGNPAPARSSVLIFPNPNAGTFTVALPAPAPVGTQLRLTDLTGRVLLERSIPASSRMQTVEVEVLPGGIYFFKISEASGRVFSGKIMIVSQ